MIRRRITPLNLVLADMDERTLPSGKTKTFSIRFCTSKGELVYLHRAISCGLRFDMKKHDYKAVQAVDALCRPSGHVYPVWIHSIFEYNDNSVFNEQRSQK